MFFNLKKKLMCRAIDKRNHQQPFDYQYAENFSLEGIEDPWINNSYYFSAHDDTMSIFLRLGRRVNVEETWFAVYWEGMLYSLKQETFPQGNSPILIGKINDHWTLFYQGKLNENDDVLFQAKFIAKQKPIDFTSNMPAARMATGMANEKWDKPFFEALQNVSGQCHYEQEGVLEGQMTLNGKTVAFQMPCVRDHSFGKRDWNYMNNHLWLMAVASERQFNYSLVSYPVMSVLEVGHYRDEAGMHYMMQADVDFRQIGQGVVPQELSFHVKLDNGKTLPVVAKVLTGVTYRFQNGQYILHENIAEFTIDGKICRGIFEIGFNGDSSRYFNQRDLSSIKR